MPFRRSDFEEPKRFRRSEFGAAPDNIAPFISGGNILTKALDVLNTPQQLAFGALRGGIEGQPLGESAVTGARENIGFADVLKSAGVPELGSTANVPLLKEIPVLGNITGRGTIGLAGDILIDIPFLGPAGKAGQKLTKGVEAFIDSVRGITKEEKVVKGLIKEASSRFRAAKSRAIGKAEEARDRIEAIARETGEPVAKIRSRIIGISEKRSVPEQLDFLFVKEERAAQAFEKELGKSLKKRLLPGKSEDTTRLFSEEMAAVTTARASIRVEEAVQLKMDFPGVVEEAGLLKKQFREQLIREQSRGLGTIELNDSGLDYVTHLLTQEAKDKLLAASTDLQILGRRWSGRHAFQLARKLRGSHSELSVKARRGELPGFEGIKIEKLFEDDPVILQAVRTLAGEKAIVDAELFLQSAARLGRRGPEIAGEFEKLDIVKRGTGTLPAYMDNFTFRPEVRRHLDAYFERTLNPKSPAGQFLSLFDKVQSEWKLITLAPFPAYHARNQVGNVWNNFIGGVIDPRWYQKAAAFQKTTDPEKVFQLGSKQFTKFQLDDLLADYGVTNQFRAFLVTPKGLTKRSFVERKFLPSKVGVQVGTLLEDNARIAHFFAKMEKGASIREAVSSVKLHLFDFNDLSDIEKSFFRRVFPFYSWTRFNLPLQMRSIVEQPLKFAALGDVINAVERDVPVPKNEDKLVSEWMKENTNVRVRQDEEGNPEYFLLGGWLPAADVSKIASHIKLAVDNLTPFAKAPIEFITNKSLFLGRDIENFPGEKERFVGVPLPKKATNLLRNLRILTEADRLLAAVDEGLDVDLTSRRGEKASTAIIRTLFGTKLFPVDLQKQRLRLRFERLNLIKERRRDLLRNQGLNKEVIDGLLEQMVLQ